MKNSFVVAFIFSILLSCTREKIRENGLEGNTYEMQITVGSSVKYDLRNPVSISFENCNNRKELCSGQWSYDGSTANFFWKFSSHGKKFEIENQTLFELNTPLYHSVGDCYNCSGVYTVKELKKNPLKLKLESNNTLGYPGQKVLLLLQK